MQKILILALFSALSVGCGTIQSTVYETELPAACRWKTAHIIKHSVSSQLKATDMGPDWRAGYDYFSLELNTTGKKLALPLKNQLGGEYKEPEYQIKINSDCNGALLSANGNDYYYLGIDTVQPFICQHRVIQANQPIPKTDDFLLQILSQAKQHQPASQYTEENELPAAFAHASRIDAGLPLHWAAIRFLGQSQYVSHEMLAAASALLKKHPEMNDYVFKQAQQGVSAYLQIMAQMPDPNYQELLGDWLNNELNQPASDKSCERMSNFAEALLLKTALLKTGSSKVIHVLGKLANHTHCPLLKKGGNPYDDEVWSIRGENSRIWAVKGLLLIHSPEANKILQQLAAPACQKYRRVNNAVVSEKLDNFYYHFDLTPDQITNNGYKVTTHERPGLSCFAQLVERVGL